MSANSHIITSLHEETAIKLSILVPAWQIQVVKHAPIKRHLILQEHAQVLKCHPSPPRLGRCMSVASETAILTITGKAIDLPQ